MESIKDYMAISLEDEYKQAQENPRKRRRFLRKVDLAEARSYVRRVRYCPENVLSYLGDKRINFVMTTDQNLFGIIRPTITIYPIAFSPGAHPRLDDFLSTLIDHEGYHARLEYEGDPTTLLTGAIGNNWEEELKVHDYQLRQMDKRNCSDLHRKLTETNREIYNQLLSPRETPEVCLS